MARPTKQGIEYFPVDVQFDDKIDLYLMESGAHGLAILFVLWQFIYRDEGYFVVNSPDLHLRINYKLKIPLEDIKACIQICLSRGIFDLYLHDQYGILTSRGIQKRYLEITRKRRSVRVFLPFLLVERKEYPATTPIEQVGVTVPISIQNPRINSAETIVNSAETTSQAEFPRNQSTYSGINSVICTQSKVKESKGKKSKELREEGRDENKKGADAPQVNKKDLDLAVKPEDVSEQVWNDFQKQRKTKGFPFTVTALQSTIREAEKVGCSLEEALVTCCRRGWRGFEARYVQANGHQKTGADNFQSIDYGTRRKI